MEENTDGSVGVLLSRFREVEHTGVDIVCATPSQPDGAARHAFATLVCVARGGEGVGGGEQTTSALHHLFNDGLTDHIVLCNGLLLHAEESGFESVLISHQSALEIT